MNATHIRDAIKTTLLEYSGDPEFETIILFMRGVVARAERAEALEEQYHQEVLKESREGEF